MNSTFYSNAAACGGAINSYDAQPLILVSNTIVGNTKGGGICASGATLGNNIVAANAGGDVAGQIKSLGNNLIGNVNGSSGWFASDLKDTDPQLEGLADNGGATQTMALKTGSPAIGAGFCQGNRNFPSISLDQRGAPRKNPCDIGAFESGAKVP